MLAFKSAMLAAAIATMASGAHVLAQEPASTPELAPTEARPADPLANLPSATGAQATLPSGAVTGAGNAQLETAARAEAGLRGRAVAAELQAQEARGSDQPHRDAGGAQGGANDPGAGGAIPSEPRAR
jgi:hypothetical protein